MMQTHTSGASGACYGMTDFYTIFVGLFSRIEDYPFPSHFFRTKRETNLK
jgi:hypothetical protein